MPACYHEPHNSYLTKYFEKKIDTNQVGHSYKNIYLLDSQKHLNTVSLCFKIYPIFDKEQLIVGFLNKIQLNEHMGVILFDLKGMIFGINSTCLTKYKFSQTMVCLESKQSYISIYNIFLGLDKLLDEHNESLSYEKMPWSKIILNLNFIQQATISGN